MAKAKLFSLLRQTHYLMTVASEPVVESPDWSGSIETTGGKIPRPAAAGLVGMTLCAFLFVSVSLPDGRPLIFVSLCLCACVPSLFPFPFTL
jgi:hypothetical protein